MHFRSSKSVIMCFQHMQETLQNNPSYENLSGAQHGSRTIFSVLCVLIVAVAFDWAAFSRIATTTTTPTPTATGSKQRPPSWSSAMRLGGRRCALPPNPPLAFLFFKVASSHGTITTSTIHNIHNNEQQELFLGGPPPEHLQQQQEHLLSSDESNSNSISSGGGGT